MDWLIFFGIVAVYYVIGYVLAVLTIPRSRMVANKEWSTKDTRNDSVRAQFLIMLFFWWIRYPCIWVIKLTDKTIERYDPVAVKERQKALESQLRDRDQTIDHLERELKLGKYAADKIEIDDRDFTYPFIV